MLNSDVILSMMAVIVPLVEILGVIAAVHAIMNVRTSQGAIAWAISLVTFPWVALILYAIFGRNRFKGYVLLRTSRDDAIHHVIEDISKKATQNRLIREGVSKSEQALTHLADLPITRFNKSRLLIDGNETFKAIFEGIESAKDYILVHFFIVKNDELGLELKSRLIKKRREKVRIYFLYDEIGCHKLPRKYIQEMEKEGIVVSQFHTTKGRTNRFQINFRNHRKIVVIDGKRAYVGGHNVGDEYVSRHPKFGAWRDTHLELEGPIVQAIQFCFVEDWYWAKANIPDLNWEFQKSENGSEETLMIASGPADRLDTCGLMFVQTINMAVERIWIASPYFVPDQQILSALKLAAMRGVDVRILLPEKPDHRIVYLASFSYYQDTIPLGVKLYRYRAGFMHQKVFLVDSAWAAVGTANLDNRSFRLHFELTLLNNDPGFIGKVEDMLCKDFNHSRKVKLSEYTRRSFFFKLIVRITRLLEPLL